MTTAADYHLAPGCRVVFRTPTTHAHFYGYYYPSPLDTNCTRLLAHRVAFDGRDIGPDDEAEVGYFDLGTGHFHAVGRTNAFNWQQGSMLQWLPGSNGNEVIYNFRDGRRSFGSTVHDVITGSTRRFGLPIYALHPSGNSALCANFERLYFCRPGYNYQGVVNREWDVPVHPADGISTLEFGTGESRFLVSTSDVLSIAPRAGMHRENNWLEHMMWNPSGTRFAFLHRWATERAHRTRLLCASTDGTDLRLFPDTCFYSHMSWRSPREFTVWTQPPTASGLAVRAVARSQWYRALLKPIYQRMKRLLPDSTPSAGAAVAAWIKYQDPSGNWDRLTKQPRMAQDGHNSWTSDGRFMLTDTYEDENAYRRLLLYDSARDQVREIGRFLSRHNVSGFRCDLHPRWSPHEKWVIIDTSHVSAFRQIWVIDISRILEEAA